MTVFLLESESGIHIYVDRQASKIQLYNMDLWNQGGGWTILPWPEASPMRPEARARSKSTVFIVISENFGKFLKLKGLL